MLFYSFVIWLSKFCLLSSLFTSRRLYISFNRTLSIHKHLLFDFTNYYHITTLRSYFVKCLSLFGTPCPHEWTINVFQNQSINQSMSFYYLFIYLSFTEDELTSLLNMLSKNIPEQTTNMRLAFQNSSNRMDLKILK